MKIEFANKLNVRSQYFSLKAIYEEDQFTKKIVKDINYITSFFGSKESYIYLGKKDEYTYEDLFETIDKVIEQNKFGFNIYIESFVNSLISKREIVEIFTLRGIYKTHTLWNIKLKDPTKKDPKPIVLIGPNDLIDLYSRSVVEANNVNLVRDLQIMPHNHLNSENYPKIIKEYFKDLPNVEIKVLSKKDIEDEKMGLLLSVNLASAYEPRVVVITFKGDAGSKQHLAMVGKGIMYDSGGMNIKTQRFMNGMKYDMSGSAIVMAAVKTCAELKYKTNVSAVLVCTDNLISPKGSKADDVYIASNGIAVEVNNTDAEGRLVMADGLIYAWKRLHATHLLDIATLTGAIKVALGDTYTGVWTTTDKIWTHVEKAANEAHELVWRLPFHNDFIESMKKSLVANLKNTDFSGKGGSISAAMFLKEFTNKLPYAHFDIAGTAKIEDETTGIMVRTLANYAKYYDKD